MNELSEKWLFAIATIVVLPFILFLLKKRFESLPAKGPIRSIDLRGRWSGDGWAYDLVGRLQVTSEVQGQFQWTLLENPDGRGLGKTSTEFVKGFIKGKELTVSSHKVDNVKLATLTDYSIQIDEDAGTFQGTTIDREKNTGTVQGSVTVAR